MGRTGAPMATDYIDMGMSITRRGYGAERANVRESRMMSACRLRHQGLSFAAIAKDLGVSAFTVRSDIRAAVGMYPKVAEIISADGTRGLLTFKGRTMQIHKWAAEVGLDAHLISDRIYRLGWPVERALSAPPRQRGWWVTNLLRTLRAMERRKVST